MRDSARIGYAQARVQARLGDRPSEPFWRELEAGREFPHVLDWVRSSGLAEAVSAMPGDVGVHGLETRLRRHWVATCGEIAEWYPEPTGGAIRWLRWLPFLPAFTWLAQGRPAPAWMADDPLLAPIAAAEPAERAARLGDAGLEALAAEFAGSGDVAGAWRRRWRERWPDDAVDSLGRLDGALARLQPGAGSGPGFDALVDAVAADALRLFRRHPCSPVAGLCLLVLLWLDHLRLRAALVSARLFGAGEPAWP